MTVDDLLTLVEREFSALRRQRDEDRQEKSRWHDENKLTLQRIEQEVKNTNGRVTRNEEKIRALSTWGTLASGAAGGAATLGLMRLLHLL